MPTVKYLWDMDAYLAEMDEGGTITTLYTVEPEQYGRLVSSRAGGTTSFCHFDALGSTRQLTTHASTLSDSWIYDASGATVSRTGTTVTPFTWAAEVGYYYDVEIACFHVRTRTYTPATARWASPDPLLFEDGMNRYSYGHNSPIATIDPSGLITVETLVTSGFIDPECGVKSTADFDFVLDKAAPCKGRMVQQVSYYCNVNTQCDTCDICDTGMVPCKAPTLVATYWETTAEWTVFQGGTKTTGGIDRGESTAKPQSCGVKRSVGIIRFFCEKDLELGAFRIPQRYGEGTCQIGASNAISVGGPGSAAAFQPKWWNTKYVKAETDGVRSLQVRWKCCDCDDDFVEPTSVPGAIGAK